MSEVSSLSPDRKILLLEVLDGQIDMCGIVFHLHKHYRDCDMILKYLIRYKLTGYKLANWIKFEHDNSMLKAFNHVLRQIKRDHEYLTLIKRDFIDGV